MRYATTINPHDGSTVSVSRCRSCGVPIYWARTAAGKLCPYDIDFNNVASTQSHFTTCPDARGWTKRTRDDPFDMRSGVEASAEDRPASGR